MRNPNGYGSVVNLGKGRRKPYAIRVPNGYKKNNSGKVILSYKYLEYFDNKKDANIYLAQYNSGAPIKEHLSLQECPNFEEEFGLWFEDFISRKERTGKATSSQLSTSYRAAFKKCSYIHKKKMVNIRYEDIQNIADSIAKMSVSTISNVKFILISTFQYSKVHGHIADNFIADVIFEYSLKEDSIHSSFSRKEIDALWSNKTDSKVRIILIMIYTGMRIEEIMRMKNENVYLAEKYMTGGVKTISGKNRCIPIADKIFPFVEEIFSSSIYLLDNNGKRYPRAKFLNSIWQPVMTKLNMQHLPHDTRYTCATLLDRASVNENAKKKILGHKGNDITNGVYVQKDIFDLLEAINSI